MTVYPEHEKMKAVEGKSQSIGYFIDTLQEKGMFICKFLSDEGPHGGLYIPQTQSIEQLLAEHFEIDLKVIEQEKQAMLEEFREQTKELEL